MVCYQQMLSVKVANRSTANSLLPGSLHKQPTASSRLGGVTISQSTD